MRQAEGDRNGEAPIDFSLAVLEGARPRVQQAKRNYPATEKALRPYELNLSAAQVLLGSTAFLGSMVFVWELVKIWLFGR